MHVGVPEDKSLTVRPSSVCWATRSSPNRLRCPSPPQRNLSRPSAADSPVCEGPRQSPVNPMADPSTRPFIPSPRCHWPWRGRCAGGSGELTSDGRREKELRSELRTPSSAAPTDLSGLDLGLPSRLIDGGVPPATRATRASRRSSRPELEGVAFEGVRSRLPEAGAEPAGEAESGVPEAELKERRIEDLTASSNDFIGDSSRTWSME